MTGADMTRMSDQGLMATIHELERRRDRAQRIHDDVEFTWAVSLLTRARAEEQRRHTAESQRRIAAARRAS